jgi:CRP-like cAMP-binding protein
MKPEFYRNLSDSPLFKGQTADDIRDLLSRVLIRVKTFKRGNTLAFRGDPCLALMIILEGVVRGEMLDWKGKIIEIEMISAPRPLAPAFLFGKNNRFPVDAVAVDEVTILWIPKNSLLSLFQISPGLLSNYLDTISSRTQFLSEKIWFMSFKTIRDKIASYVLSLSGPDENPLILPKNQRELSEFFGVTRPALSRIFAALKRDNILEYKGKKITIIDREKLIGILSDTPEE